MFINFCLENKTLETAYVNLKIIIHQVYPKPKHNAQSLKLFSTISLFSTLQIPLHPAEHYYLHTKPVPGLAPSTPVVRDPDGFVYFRENEGRFLAGGFQPWAKPAFVSGPMPTSMKVSLFCKTPDLIFFCLGLSKVQLPPPIYVTERLN